MVPAATFFRAKMDNMSKQNKNHNVRNADHNSEDNRNTNRKVAMLLPLLLAAAGHLPVLPWTLVLLGVLLCIVIAS
jgi:hypothetical protein